MGWSVCEKAEQVFVYAFGVCCEQAVGSALVFDISRARYLGCGFPSGEGRGHSGVGRAVNDERGKCEALEIGRKSVVPQASTQSSVAIGLAIDASVKLQSRTPWLTG